MLNYELLLSTLEEVQKDEYAAKASGLRSRMELFETYFGLKLVFSEAEQFSTDLHAKKYYYSRGNSSCRITCSHLKSLILFYELVVTQS